MSVNKIIHVYDKFTGDMTELQAKEVQGLGLVIDATVAGRTMSTVGVADAAGKRFAEDADVVSLINLEPVGDKLISMIEQMATEKFLAKSLAINMNVAPHAVTLLTVPALTHYIVTKVVVTNTALTVAKFEVGSTAPNDYVAAAVHPELAAIGDYLIIEPPAGYLVLNPGDILIFTSTVSEGAAMTADVYVYGFVF
jgi:hypothetical protein